MNLFDAVREMSTLVNPTKDAVWELLDDGYYIIAGDNNKYGYSMMKYVLFYNDGMLWVGKLSDSTSTEIVITLMMAARLKGTLYEVMWDCYFASKDFFYIDTPGYLSEATLHPEQKVRETISRGIKPGEINIFNDPYVTPKIQYRDDTSIYIENNKDAMFLGLEVVEDTVKKMVNTTIVKKEEDADFTILLLPTATKAPHNKFFEWLDSKTASIPIVSDTLKEKGMKYDTEKKVLLYWSSNAFMSGLVDPPGTEYRAAIELCTAIDEYHRQ